LVLGGKEGEEEGKEGNAQPGESLVVGTEAVAAGHLDLRSRRLPNRIFT
jgi:hypothetical protein